MRRVFLALMVVCVALAGESSRGEADAPAAPPDPFGHASIESGTLTDSRSGRVFRIEFIANESGQAGMGNVTLWVRPGGPGVPSFPVNLCSIHGGNVGFPSSSPFPGPGTQPLTTIECGTAGGQIVSVDGCRVTTTMHGVVHADAPFSPYSGTTTIDFSMTRNPGRGVYEGHLTIHTPKEKIHLSGPVDGLIVVDTCG
jgi:hypothetical protein